MYDSRLPKREHLKTLQALSPESQGRILALTVLRVPYSLDTVAPPLQSFDLGTAAERKRNTLERCKHFNLKAKAGSWP